MRISLNLTVYVVFVIIGVLVVLGIASTVHALRHGCNGYDMGWYWVAGVIIFVLALAWKAITVKWGEPY